MQGGRIWRSVQLYGYINPPTAMLFFHHRALRLVRTHMDCSSKLCAPRLIRVRRVISYVVNSLALKIPLNEESKCASEPSKSLSVDTKSSLSTIPEEDYIEILCKDKVLCFLIFLSIYYLFILLFAHSSQFSLSGHMPALSLHSTT